MTQLTLLCLPYSGASAMVYSRWRRKLLEWLRLQPVELPGRGARLSDTLLSILPILADESAGSLYEHGKHRGQSRSVMDLLLATAS